MSEPAVVAAIIPLPGRPGEWVHAEWDTPREAAEWLERRGFRSLAAFFRLAERRAEADEDA